MLIATDLDGTLVPPDAETVSERTARVLRRLDRAGIPVVFVTARPLRWMDGLWPHVGQHGVAIVSNGAIVYDVHDRRVRTHHGIEPEAGLALVEAITAAAPGATFAIECVDGIRADLDYSDPTHVPVGAPVGPLHEIWDVPAAKLLVRHDTIDPDVFRDGVSAAVGADATPTWTLPGLIEISASGVTKASALIELCAELGVAAEDVVAFGDMPNDLPMLTWAGTSYAMAGAHESVRAIADHVAPPCEEDGVAQVLESFVPA